MNRRSFLGRLAAVPAAALVLSRTQLIQRSPAPLFEPGSYAYTSDHRMYRYLRTPSTVTTGQVVMQDGTPVGFSAGPLAKGEYGWVQVAGPASLPIV